MKAKFKNYLFRVSRQRHSVVGARFGGLYMHRADEGALHVRLVGSYRLPKQLAWQVSYPRHFKLELFDGGGSES